ncbi:MAG: hypothetical protein NZ529_04795 [Cytophagaceae bacterium]|nr:hypothetical protein [Cytophagaceae bacterium]MDW8456094.1 D-alanyl-lipoteichoic acid biosynthesis protein DltD [Cytophagaceae bacterium]
MANKNRQRAQIENNIKFYENKKLLFAGSSHTLFGISDSFEGIYNVAAINEPFLFTLKKIQMLKPQHVVVSLNTQNLQYDYENIFENGILNKPQYEYIFEKLGNDERNDVLSRMSFEARAFFHTKRLLPFLGSKLKLNDDDPLFGGWKNAGKKSQTETWRIEKRFKDEFEKTQFKPSAFQIKYLHLLCNYCKKNGVKLTFISTPLHPLFLKKIPSKVYQEFYNLVDELKTTYDASYLNYSSFPMPENFFLDGDHLNGEGAKRFTSVLIKEFSSTLFDVCK